MGGLLEGGRSLAETPTYLVATVTTVLVFVCLFVQRSIYRFGRWLKRTRRKALYVSLEKIKEELMLLGLISLLLAQWANWISQICVNSSLFSSKFYLCSEEDFETYEHFMFRSSFSFLNESDIPPEGLTSLASHQCGAGREPFVSSEGLEQLHRFLFVLGITHVLYSCLAVGLAMSKIYSWRKWENQASAASDGDVQAKPMKVMRRQTTFVFQHTSHPWSRNRILIWMLCFFHQFRTSIKRSDYFALRLGFITKHNLPLSYNFHKYMVRSMEDEFQGILGIRYLYNSEIKLDKLMIFYYFEYPVIDFCSSPLWVYAIVCIFINIHGLNIYFWLSFIPAVLVMLVGTKLQHVVSSLALDIVEPSGPPRQVKPRDDLFWFGKPEILLRLIQFIIFQNAFEMATFIWSLWGFKQRSCFMKNHVLIVIRLASGVLVQFWCSNTTVPLNVIVTQMGSRCKKALVAESVRESLHSWCKRVKEKSRQDRRRRHLNSHTDRSVCSLDSTIHKGDEEVTVASGTLSRSSSMASVLNRDTVTSIDQVDTADLQGGHCDPEFSLRMEEYLKESLKMSSTAQPLPDQGDDDAIDEESGNGQPEVSNETLWELFMKT